MFPEIFREGGGDKIKTDLAILLGQGTRAESAIFGTAENCLLIKLIQNLTQLTLHPTPGLLPSSSIRHLPHPASGKVALGLSSICSQIKLTFLSSNSLSRRLCVINYGICGVQCFQFDSIFPFNLSSYHPFPLKKENPV